MIEVTCIQCGKKLATFPSETRRGGGKYCSRRCMGLAYRGVPRPKPNSRKIKECAVCGKPFEARPSLEAQNKGKYCSRRCYDSTRATRVVRECQQCGAKFKTLPLIMGRGDGRYCSRKCVARARVGEKNANWKGGVKAGNRRTTAGYQVWREAVFTRDNWTCQDCGKRGGDHHAHHVWAFSKFPEYRFDVWNGITLCIPCHRRYHHRNTSLSREVSK